MSKRKESGVAPTLEEQFNFQDKTAIDDYEPHAHRHVPKPTNNFETLIHMLKAAIGTGILAMPQAFSRAGIVTAIISTIVIGIIATHCLHLLIEAQYEMCKRKRVPLLDYRDVMVAAIEVGPKPLRPFSKASGVLVDAFVCTYQIGICCVYILFMATNNKKIIDPYYMISLEIHMVIVLGPLIIANCIPNLKMLAPFSLVANLLTLFGVMVVFYYLLSGKKSYEPLVYFSAIGQFSLFFGSMLFAITAIGVVFALENNMSTPKFFVAPLGVINLGMSTIIVFYTAMGWLGYIFCVSQCSDSITLDMPANQTLTVAVLAMFGLAIFISYVLNCYVPVDIFWRRFIRPRLERRGTTRFTVYEYGLRITMCFFTFVMALLVPRLGLFISLFGAFCISVLAMMIPAFIQICTHMPNRFGRGKYILIKNIIIIMIGFFIMTTGTYSAVKEIVMSFTK